MERNQTGHAEFRNPEACTIQMDFFDGCAESETLLQNLPKLCHSYRQIDLQSPISLDVLVRSYEYKAVLVQSAFKKHMCFFVLFF